MDGRGMGTVSGRRTKLFYVRRAFGLTMRDVKALTGIPPAQLSVYERGLSEPSVTTALKLARLFNTTVEKLFDPKEKP